MQSRIIMIVALFAFLITATSARAVPRDAFNGQWKVTVTPQDEARKAGEKEFKDTLIFKGAMFKSTECEKKGFKETQYEENTQHGIVATFKAETKSDKEGAATWTGDVNGNVIKGELEWKKPDGTVVKYSYTGEKQ